MTSSKAKAGLEVVQYLPRMVELEDKGNQVPGDIMVYMCQHRPPSDFFPE